MNIFENQLRKALSRKEPSALFLPRLLELLAVCEKHDMSRMKTLFWLSVSPRLRWATVGVLACLLMGLGQLGYQRIERHRRAQVEGERAKEQLVLALRITNEKLSIVQKKLLRIRNIGTLDRVER
jgi:hypothetical protein